VFVLPDWLPPLLVSPFVGSFLGVLVRRLPRGLPVALARSRCEACGRTLGARDMVPVASYVVQQGRCRGCRAPIAPMHLGIELAAMGVALWAVLWAALALAKPGVDPVRLWITCGLGWTLLALGWIDWDHLRLPDALTLPLLLAGLGAALLLDPAAAPEHAAAAVLGYLALRGLAVGYRALRGREGLGAGDAKLLAAAGAWVGMEALPAVVLGGALFTIGLVAAMRLRDRAVGRATPIPFGPGLCAALWLAWLYGAGAMLRL
jgi:leader peptidase (prepilin peptidase)/N-methyltransferase